MILRNKYTNKMPDFLSIILSVSVLLVTTCIFTAKAHDNVFPGGALPPPPPSEHEERIPPMDVFSHPAAPHNDDSFRETGQEIYYPPGVSPTIYEHDGHGNMLEREVEADYETDRDTLGSYNGEKEIPVVVEMDVYPPGVPQRYPQGDTVSIQPGTNVKSPKQHDDDATDHDDGTSHSHDDDSHSILVNEKELKHIEQHMEVPMNTTNMNSEELAFHYFKMHDADNNENLDGLELIKFMMHFHEHEEGRPPRLYADEELAASVDHLLADNDKDNDGYISYAEYKQANKNSADKNEAKQDGS